MAHVDSDGWRIWYEVAGEGAPIVLCGGPIMLHGQFGEAPALLARDHRVVTWNWRGTGRSDRTWMAGLRFDHWVDDLARVMDAAEIERSHFWGISSGSLFAIRFAARFPDRVGKLVLYPSMKGPTADVAAFQAEIVRRQGVEQLIWNGFWHAASAEALADGSVARIAQHEIAFAREHMPTEVLARANALYTDVDLTPDVARLAAPVLLLAGASGRLGTGSPALVAAIAAFRAMLPGVEVAAIPRAGGTMAAVEAPEACVAAIRAFLASDD